MFCVDFQLCGVDALNACVGPESTVIYTSDRFSIKSLFFVWKGFLPLFHLCNSKENCPISTEPMQSSAIPPYSCPSWYGSFLQWACVLSHTCLTGSISLNSIREKKIILISPRWDVVKGDTWALLAVPFPTQQRRWPATTCKWTRIVDYNGHKFSTLLDIQFPVLESRLVYMTSLNKGMQQKWLVLYTDLGIQVACTAWSLEHSL